jgi:hypothetical protein
MTSEAKIRDRRYTVLAAVIGTVLAGYAGSAAALEFEFDNGGRLNWNTTFSVGASWRAGDPNRLLYTRADGSLLGLYSGTPLIPGTAIGPKDGIAGQQSAGDGNLNYAKGDMFSQPWKVISDVEYKKGDFGGLVRIKAWYDNALNNNSVRMGNQSNEFNGERGGLGPHATTLCPPGTNSPTCFANSLPGQNAWPKKPLSDKGFEAEQKFDNVMLLDAYVYGSFAMGNTDLQLRLGNQVVNWGESVFIQGVNQINPIDVPAARRAGAELKEVLLPVWMAYANWGLPFGSVEAFYQLKWNNTSVDGCGTYFTQTGTLISSDPGSCRSITVLGSQNGAPAAGTTSPLVPQLGSAAYLQATGAYVPAVKGKDAKDGGQFGVAYRFPLDFIDTEMGLYAMNVHSRLPISSGRTGTNPGKDLTAAQRAVLQGAGVLAQDSWGWYWRTSPTGTRYRSLFPALIAGFNPILTAYGQQANLQGGVGYWEYPEDIQIYGISAATNLVGWSVSAELSYSHDVPVQVNGNDLIGGSITGIGPMSERARAAAQQAAGGYYRGYDRFDKTQFQVNTVKTFSNILGADNLLIVGEVGMQKNNVPDYTKGGIRYGRGFMYGSGSTPAYLDPATKGLPEGQPGFGAISGGNLCSPTYQNAPVPIANGNYNASYLGCKNDGYVTDFSWGYRIRVSADYSNLLNSGVTMTPSIFWSQDVEGVSMDPTFNQGRETLGLGLKFTYNKKYTLETNWVQYANNNYDPLFDRDYYSASVGVTF